MPSDLSAICTLMARRDFLASRPGKGQDDNLLALVDEVPGLVAEMERLRDELAELHRVCEQFRQIAEGFGTSGRSETLRRLVEERDVAEGKVLPAGWTIHEGVWVRTVAHRTDLEITVHRGVSNGFIPFARIVAYHAAGNVVKRIEAKTLLAAIEAADAWLKENPR